MNIIYGIIVNKDGSFYTSVIFGEFCPVTAESGKQLYLERTYNRFYIILNEEKTKLVKKYVHNRKTDSPNPLVIITDYDKTDWVIDDNHCGCIDLLNNICGETGEVDVTGELLKKCIDIDKKFIYNEYPEIKNQKDINNLLHLANWFHEAVIIKCEKTVEEELYVLFAVWDCKIEIWFKGDISYNYSFYRWFEVTLFTENGFIYLIEGENRKSSDLCDRICWFKAKSMKYHVVIYNPSENAVTYLEQITIDENKIFRYKKK